MTANNEGPRSARTESFSSLAKSHSTIRSQSQTLGAPSSIKTIVTSPPWARDEPPSPKEDDFLSAPSNASLQRTVQSRPSDVGSFSSGGDPSIAGPSRWWTFARPRHDAAGPLEVFEQDPSSSSPKAEKKGISLSRRSMSWLPSYNRRSQEDTRSPVIQEKDYGEPTSPERADTERGLSIALPPPSAPFTMAHNRTPGWNTPWTPRAADDMVGRRDYLDIGNGGIDQSDDGMDHISPWQKRKKKIRKFLLNNAYVPLLFRFVNITFTTAALGIAIRIRIIESRNGVMGAVGSSPTLVVIFAPLTLVHVMIAIYAEYFGRPLGIWRTSWKLAHTLVEVVFICAWSAGLALCFDNFFTSVIPCASPSSVSWYSSIQRPPSPISGLDVGAGHRICTDQLALICLVCVGLIMYCTNLVISLYRIFEKVKYRPVP